MDAHTTAARVLMGDSLGFHILFVMFGLTLPIFVSLFEFIGLTRKDDRYLQFAHFLSKIMAMLVVAGVVSGTIIALQMSFVWPGILKFGGEVIGLPFMFETYAFLVEAIFLGLYMYTWNSKRVSGWLHWAFGVMVVVGATASAYTITSVNGWMNLPTGFDIVAGKFENVDVVAAMFSVPALVTFAHSMPGYYVAAGLAVAGFLAAWRLQLVRRGATAKKLAFNLSLIHSVMVFVLISFIFSAITADITGKYLAKHEPEKLAAIELHYQTGSNAPLIVGGVSDGAGGIVGPHIKIPGALSLLACGTTACEVQGLSETHPSLQPPTYIHTLFDIKMTLITVLAVVLVAYLYMYYRMREWLKNRLLISLFVAVSWFGIAIVELGWMMTEIGRQPWAVRGHVLTADAVTSSQTVATYGVLFPVGFVILGVVTVIALRHIIKTEARSKKGVL